MPARHSTAVLVLAALAGPAGAAPPAAGRLDSAPVRIAQPVRPGSALIVNRGTRPLWVLQVAAVDAPGWGADRLGSGSLAPGGKGLLRLGAPETCRYDLRATFAGGREVTRFDVDLCRDPEVALSDEDGAGPLPAPRAGVVVFRVANGTGAPVVSLHVSPSEGPERGDVLGAWVMGQGMHYTGRAAAGGSCLFRLRSAFSVRADDAVVMAGQNLCESREIVLPPRAAAQGPQGVMPHPAHEAAAALRPR